MSNNQSKRPGKGKKTSLSSLLILIVLGLAYFLSGGSIGQDVAMPQAPGPASSTQAALENPGEKDTVYAYLAMHGELPDYYITKGEARELGWPGGGLEAYAPGKMIGGDRFQNFEGILPKESGRTWTEADVGTMGKSSRGAKRMVFSSDGLIYYTEDHYDSFEFLGEVE